MEVTIPVLALPSIFYTLAVLALLIVTAASTLGLRDKAAPIRLFLRLFVVWLTVQLLFNAFVKAFV
jgi:hypothetical protein